MSTYWLMLAAPPKSLCAKDHPHTLSPPLFFKENIDTIGIIALLFILGRFSFIFVFYFLVLAHMTFGVHLRKD